MRFFCRFNIKQRFDLYVRFWLFSNYNRFSHFLRLTYFKYKTIAISRNSSTFAYRILNNIVGRIKKTKSMFTENIFASEEVKFMLMLLVINIVSVLIPVLQLATCPLLAVFFGLNAIVITFACACAFADEVTIF